MTLFHLQLVDAHGMEVSSVYFRRLLQSNASNIFITPNAPRTTSAGSDGSGSYPLLVSEIQKLTRTPQQSYNIAEALDTSDGDVFRDFDLSTFMDHFRLDPVAKITVALACRTVSKQDIRTKGTYMCFFAVCPSAHLPICPSPALPDLPFESFRPPRLTRRQHLLIILPLSAHSRCNPHQQLQQLPRSSRQPHLGRRPLPILCRQPHLTSASRPTAAME